MRARNYALAFVASAAGLFIAVVAVNLAIDTQGMFGTGLLGQPLNPNTRYQRFVDYQSASDRYDGLLFGSSRALDLPLEELQRMKGASFANFAVQFGLITDDLPILEYVLREKTTKRQRLQAVFVLLDVDSFGAEPKTNRFLQTMLAPAVTGEQPLRFWWRYLTAIQVGTWRKEIVRAWKRQRSEEGRNASAAVAPGPAAQEGTLVAGAAPAVVREPQPEPWGLAPLSQRITGRPDYARQLRVLRDLSRLCQGNGVQLFVAASPLSNEEAAKYNPAELARVVDDVSRIVPVWDFTNSQWLAQHPELWSDSRHFKEEVGRLILARMFGDAAVAVPADFGRLRATASR
ncbi:MAG TPA: hypothetical protein VG100_01170 [Xanthobacteraceae bacterium]|nr:hypothetical protein [Xanthobacteraceae bacterium]